MPTTLRIVAALAACSWAVSGQGPPTEADIKAEVARLDNVKKLVDGALEGGATRFKEAEDWAKDTQVVFSSQQSALDADDKQSQVESAVRHHMTTKMNLEKTDKELNEKDESLQSTQSQAKSEEQQLTKDIANAESSIEVMGKVIEALGPQKALEEAGSPAPEFQGGKAVSNAPSTGLGVVLGVLKSIVDGSAAQLKQFTEKKAESAERFGEIIGKLTDSIANKEGEYTELVSKFNDRVVALKKTKAMAVLAKDLDETLYSAYQEVATITQETTHGKEMLPIKAEGIEGEIAHAKSVLGQAAETARRAEAEKAASATQGSSFLKASVKQAKISPPVEHERALVASKRDAKRGHANATSLHLPKAQDYTDDLDRHLASLRHLAAVAANVKQSEEQASWSLLPMTPLVALESGCNESSFKGVDPASAVHAASQVLYEGAKKYQSNEFTRLAQKVEQSSAPEGARLLGSLTLALSAHAKQQAAEDDTSMAECKAERGAALADKKSARQQLHDLNLRKAELTGDKESAAARSEMLREQSTFLADEKDKIPEFNGEALDFSEAQEELDMVEGLRPAIENENYMSEAESNGLRISLDSARNAISTADEQSAKLLAAMGERLPQLKEVFQAASAAFADMGLGQDEATTKAEKELEELEAPAAEAQKAMEDAEAALKAAEDKCATVSLFASRRSVVATGERTSVQLAQSVLNAARPMAAAVQPLPPMHLPKDMPKGHGHEGKQGRVQIHDGLPKRNAQGHKINFPVLLSARNASVAPSEVKMIPPEQQHHIGNWVW